MEGSPFQDYVRANIPKTTARGGIHEAGLDRQVSRPTEPRAASACYNSVVVVHCDLLTTRGDVAHIYSELGGSSIDHKLSSALYCIARKHIIGGHPEIRACSTLGFSNWKTAAGARTVTLNYRCSKRNSYKEVCCYTILHWVLHEELQHSAQARQVQVARVSSPTPCSTVKQPTPHALRRPGP